MLNRQAILNHPFRSGFAVFLVFFAGLCGTEITRLDVRFAIMVQDVARYGVGLFSTVNGYPYTDYPSAYVVLSYLTTLGGRVMNYAFLTLPSAVLYSVITVLILRIGEKFAPWCGIVAAGIFVSCGGVLDAMMGFGIDIPAAAAGAVMLWLLAQEQKPGRLAAVFALLLLAVFFIRGPLGLLVLAAATGGYLLFSRRWRELFFCVIAGVIVLALSLGAAYWLILRQGGRELLDLVLHWQFAARVDGVDGNDYFYYFRVGIPTFAPASLGAIAALFFLGKKTLKNPAAGWLGFVLVPLLLLSIPGCKHLRYVLIVIPALALLAGYGITFGHIPEWLQKFVTILFHYLELALPALLVLALLGLAITGLILFSWHDLPWVRWALLAVSVWWLYRATRCSEDPALGRAFLRLFLSAGMIYAMGAFHFIQCFENSRNFSRQVLAQAPARINLYELGPDHDDLKFMLYVAPEKRNEIRYVLDAKRTKGIYHANMYPYTLWSDAVTDLRSNDWLVLQEKKLKLLQERAHAAGLEVAIKLTGTLGHRKAFAVQLVPAAQSQGEK